MSPAPVITIFVRHSEECEYAGDEFAKRCDCRKHLRWSQNGKQYRRKAGTRSWAEAEEVKRKLSDQLAGRAPSTADDSRYLEDCIDLFLQTKKIQGVTASALGKYTRELSRLRDYCERNGVYTAQRITHELLMGYCGTWERDYPSTQTRFQVRARCRSFLRFCYESQWLPRIPVLPTIRANETPTMPLAADEYTRLLDAVYAVVSAPENCARVRALIQIMRWSGLAIRDAVTLERVEIEHDTEKGVYRVVTARQKTGTHVSVPLPPAIAKEVLAVSNDNPRYIFWSGNGKEDSAAQWWARYYIEPIFKAAKIPDAGHMKSHRLRDTFAVDLLQKGVPMEEVSKLLGHESIRTTEKSYAKWVKGRQDRLDSLVIGTWATPKARKSKKR